MKKAEDFKKTADAFNHPEAREKRLNDIVNYLVDNLTEESIVFAKRGKYDMSYKLSDMDKERLRLSNIQEEEVIKATVEKMKELGFHASFSRPYIHVSWQ